MIYLLHPSLTGCTAETAVAFASACESALKRYLPVATLDNPDVLAFTRCDPEDAAILFNPGADTKLSRKVAALLGKAGQVFPVAMSPATRTPPEEARVRQSFDLQEYLAVRGGDISLQMAAASFARELLSTVQPSLTRSRLALFLSHRRADGEELARSFWEKLQILKQDSFRDLADIQVGENAQDKIERNLRGSDAVLFFDTPLASTSAWVQRELQIALRSGIPVVWIRAGDHELPEGFPHPAARPHFTIAGSSVGSKDAEDAVSVAADLVRESAVQILDADARLSRIDGLEVEVKDANKLICAVRIGCGRRMPYPVEPTTHLVQFFGTRPRPEDAGALAAYPGNYTARLLLVRRSIPESLDAGKGLLAARADDYVDHLEEYARPTAKPRGKRGLIISGAFPADCGAKEQQDIVEAVRAFAQRVLERGGTIIFGSHPTFVPLIVESAKQLRLDDLDDAVRLYYSRNTKDPIRYQGCGTAIAIMGVGERNPSLTAMRDAMTSDPNAAALVAIGGMLDNRPGIVAGVVEETQLARKKGLPVLLIGAVRGMSADLAVNHAANNWQDAPNNFTPDENELLRTSLDFAGLASTFLRRLGI